MRVVYTFESRDYFGWLVMSAREQNRSTEMDATLLLLLIFKKSP